MNSFVSEFKCYSNIKCFHVKYGVGRFFAKVGGFWNVIWAEIALPNLAKLSPITQLQLDWWPGRWHNYNPSG